MAAPPFRPRRPGRSGRGGSTGARQAATLVEAVLRAHGAAAAVREHRLVTQWLDIVGDRVAARAWPSAFKDGVLYVRVANSAWMQELSFLREPIAKAANRIVGNPPLVREVKLHLSGRGEPDADADDVVAALARRRKPAKKPPKPVPPPSPAAAQAIEQETAAVADPELREAIRALRTRLGM